MIECPCCEGAGCVECDQGMFRLEECARGYVDGYIVRAVNMASMAEHHLPQAGGILDQSSWFINLWNALTGEQNRIDTERLERL